jgi:glycosyltransferase involved in cell wall biosynthesis
MISSSEPLVSFVILSYNYEDHIRQTLRSVLDQSFTDFEVVVVDDASVDRSLESIRSFDDPRIRLVVNPSNIGGSASFNRGVEEARGTWIANLDADDWIAPSKVARQLEVAEHDSSLSIIGTWVNVVDAMGQPHPKASEVEAHLNVPHRLNSVEAWVGRNPLCRSSTMVRRSLYLDIGGSDPAMVRAPDYELWTRALSHGYRFFLLPEALTFLRLHPRGVTHGNPADTTVEMAYATIRNLAPLAEARGLYDDWGSILDWLAQRTRDGDVPPSVALRLRGMAVLLPVLEDYASFRATLAMPDRAVERAGRYTLGTALRPTYEDHEKLISDIAAYIEARDFWHTQAEMWEAHYRQLAGLEP